MTSLQADKSFIVNIKLKMIFVKEMIYPTCNSLLDTFFESSSCCFPFPFFDVPQEKVAGERGEDSPVRGPEGPSEVSGVCETETGTEADVED